VFSFPSPELERHRIRTGQLASDERFGNNGFFIVQQSGSSFVLNVIASDGEGWEHVSVRVRGQKRCPTWDEMCYVKNLFWRPEECVIQYHPPEEVYVTLHQYVLHLWKPIGIDIPVPDPMLVGFK